MVTFFNTEPSISPSQLESLEEYAGMSFPEEYKVHLLQHNGGQCTPNAFKFYENGRLTDSCVDWFLAVHEGEDDNLKDYIDTYKIEEKRMPEHMLPIAHDPGGNLVCISCGKDDLGYIFFWDHELEVDYSEADDRDYSNLYLIEKSFNAFLESLTQPDAD